MLVQLEPHDSLVCTTEGVIEEKNRSGTKERRLHKVSLHSMPPFRSYRDMDLLRSVLVLNL